MSTLADRWANLRDREALGDALSPIELADIGEIENLDPEVQTYAAHMRELETYLEGKRSDHPTTPDHQLVLRALSAVQLDSPGPRVRAIDHDRELARAADPEGPGWIRLLATALSVGMTIAAALALVLYEPRSVRRGLPPETSRGPRPPTMAIPGMVPLSAQAPEGALRSAPRPEVEALLKVRTSDRGARLRRADDGQVIEADTLLGQGDRVSSGDKAGCFVIEGQLEFCLAPISTVSIKALAENNLSVALDRGHLSVHVARSSLTAPSSAQAPEGASRLSAHAPEGASRLSAHAPEGASRPRRFSVDAGEAQVVVEGPASFGLELVDEGSVVRARILRGRVRVTAAAQILEVGELKSAVFRRDSRELDVVDLSPGPAQHEWELIGAGRVGAAISSMATARAGDNTQALLAGGPARGDQVPGDDSLEVPANVPGSEPQGQAKAPRELMQDAWELLKAEQWSEAAQVYERIAREAPHSAESHIVLVRLGDLLLERLANPAGALAAFDRYLNEGGGPLEAEARHGRIAVFRRLGRAEDERQAIEEFLRFHGKSTDASLLAARLKVLAP